MIEQKINDFLEAHDGFCDIPLLGVNISSDIWLGNAPFSFSKELFHRNRKSEVRYLAFYVDRLIANEEESSCLTSPSSYIRECKKWLRKHPIHNFVLKYGHFKLCKYLEN